MLEKDIERILISQGEIQVHCKELGKELTEIYQNTNPPVVGVLREAVPSMAGIVRSIDAYLELDFMGISSYGSTTASSGEVKIVKDLDTNVESHDLLIVGDIIDSGRTLAYLMGLFKYRKAKSVKTATLLDEPEGRVVNIEADYASSNVPDEFMADYGLDCAGVYRSLLYIGVLKPSVCQPN